ncbi:MAG: hypothetical protein LAN63_06130 [Acidobacteriia bacterium]|nr:hypothetical protein [Terriglobia bacterium]
MFEVGKYYYAQIRDDRYAFKVSEVQGGLIKGDVWKLGWGREPEWEYEGKKIINTNHYAEFEEVPVGIPQAKLDLAKNRKLNPIVFTDEDVEREIAKLKKEFGS